MPDGFVVGQGDNVPFMGGHAWNPSAVTSPWVDPIWAMGTYNGGIVHVEPMIPLSFMQGDEDQMYEEDLTYVAQTMTSLPTKFSAKYDSADGYVNLILKGKSAIECNGDGNQPLTKKSKKGTKKSTKKRAKKGSKEN